MRFFRQVPQTIVYLCYTVPVSRKVHGSTCLIISILMYLGLPIDKIRSENYSETTLLEHYVLQRNLRVVRFLVSQGANLDVHSGRPIMYSIFQGREDILEVLLEAGASINACDYTGTAIDNAILYGSADAVQQLLTKGALPSNAAFKRLLNAWEGMTDRLLKIQIVRKFLIVSN